MRGVKGLSPHGLESFVAGQDNLSVEMLKSLTKEVFSDYVIYDEPTGILKSKFADVPPTKGGFIPQPWRNPDPAIAAARMPSMPR
jgi:hypothetical protein